MKTEAGTQPPLASWGGPDAVFDALEGIWTLDRTIEGQATMTGTAIFERQGTGMLKFREEGRIRMNDGQSFDAHRQYRFEHASGGFSVYFDEEPPRLFHRIVIEHDGSALTGSATHLCTPDTYDSSYRFLPDGSFVIRHTVHGPRKAYVSTTIFRRSEAQ